MKTKTKDWEKQLNNLLWEYVSVEDDGRTKVPMLKEVGTALKSFIQKIYAQAYKQGQEDIKAKMSSGKTLNLKTALNRLSKLKKHGNKHA